MNQSVIIKKKSTLAFVVIKADFHAFTFKGLDRDVQNPRAKPEVIKISYLPRDPLNANGLKKLFYHYRLLHTLNEIFVKICKK